MQELQTGADLGVGVKGIKTIKPFMSQLIISDGGWSRSSSGAAILEI
jgi:hypothetical protein